VDAGEESGGESAGKSPGPVTGADSAAPGGEVLPEDACCSGGGREEAVPSARFAPFPDAPFATAGGVLSCPGARAAR